MAEKDLLLAGTVGAAGGVEGRIKLQKMVYLLRQMGFDLGFRDFVVWNYGPFSSDLASTLNRISPDLIDEKAEHPGPDAHSPEPVTRYDYTVRSSLLPLLERILSAQFGSRAGDLRGLARELSQEHFRVLEVAATAVFVRDEMGVEDEDGIWQEVRRRKGHLGQHFDEGRRLIASWDERGLWAN
jgi:hypothetical protein